jgi:hypothetical protein
MKKLIILVVSLVVLCFYTQVLLATSQTDISVDIPHSVYYTADQNTNDYLTEYGGLGPFKQIEQFNEALDLIRLLENMPLSLKNVVKLISALRDIFPKETVREIIAVLLQVTRDIKVQDSMICMPQQTIEDAVSRLIESIEKTTNTVPKK